MSDAIWIAFIAAIPPTTIALAAAIVSWRTGQKTDVVHKQVNSNMLRMEEKLKASNDQVILLQQLVNDFATQRAIKATAAGEPIPATPTIQGVPIPVGVSTGEITLKVIMPPPETPTPTEGVPKNDPVVD